MAPECKACGETQRLLPMLPGCERYIPDLDFLIGALLDAKAARYLRADKDDIYRARLRRCGYYV